MSLIFLPPQTSYFHRFPYQFPCLDSHSWLEAIQIFWKVVCSNSDWGGRKQFYICTFTNCNVTEFWGQMLNQGHVYAQRHTYCVAGYTGVQSVPLHLACTKHRGNALLEFLVIFNQWASESSFCMGPHKFYSWPYTQHWATHLSEVSCLDILSQNKSSIWIFWISHDFLFMLLSQSSH